MTYKSYVYDEIMPYMSYVVHINCILYTEYPSTGDICDMKIYFHKGIDK